MANLDRASRELYSRTPDEMYETLGHLLQRCRQQQEQSLDRWHLPQSLRPQAAGASAAGLQLNVSDDGAFLMNDWSFSQLCRLANVNKETINRLSPETAGLVFRETLPNGNKPLQILTEGQRIRSIHARSTRGSGTQTSCRRLSSTQSIFSRRIRDSTAAPASMPANRICFAS